MKVFTLLLTLALACGCSSAPQKSLEVRHELQEEHDRFGTVRRSVWINGEHEEAAYRVKRNPDGSVFSRMIFILEQKDVVWIAVDFNDEVTRIPTGKGRLSVGDTDEDADGWPELIIVTRSSELERIYKVKSDETLERVSDEKVVVMKTMGKAMGEMQQSLMKMDWSAEEEDVEPAEGGSTIDQIWNPEQEKPINVE